MSHETLARLDATIRERRAADPASSYVAKLTAEGRPAIARKLGEEAIETMLAARADDRAAVTAEAADVIFHLALLLADMDLTLADAVAELARREGVSGLAEKAAR